MSELNNSETLRDKYQKWFIEYASYVILERAVPALEDGLKPVQRRILHALKEMDDGRFNKVANVIGATMQYHPHGDASIGDAMVNMGQKELLIDTQGNWGDYRTGDSAAAPRYIEGRLSKLANDIVFNAKTTQWQLSYDGRKKEPINLPIKFPLLLAQGAEGIAVGLSTKILPHNFNEIIDAAIKYLKGKKFELYPDFPTGGMVDVSNYNDGKRGGKIKVRVRIEEVDKKTLSIKDVPFGVTSSQLVDSILKANDSGKIKIKSVVDNTAKDVELLVQLASGVTTDQTIDALYAFTDCETSISPNACVIFEDKPMFLGVSDILQKTTDRTKALLGQELDIKLHELNEAWHYSSLEKIFIEEKIYRRIEEETTWEGVLSTIDKGLEPFKKLFLRPITQEDIIKLTEIKIKRISKFDAFKADEHIKAIEKELEEVKHHLANLTEYTIDYFTRIQKKYGAGRERKTVIKSFEAIQVNAIAIANTKLYYNAKDGFIGTSLRKEEFAFECSDLDQIIVFRKDGHMVVTKVADKTFVGKDIIHLGIFQKNDERTVYNMIYVDSKTGIAYAKRFNVTGITRDKDYDLTKGNKGSKVLYFSANHNAEAEVVTVQLSPGSKARIKVFDFDFQYIDIKGRSAGGNQLTKYPVKSIKFKAKGQSTLGAIPIYLDQAYGRINKEGQGNNPVLIGNFNPDDKLVTIYKTGTYEVNALDYNLKFDPERLMTVSKLSEETIIACIYFDKASKTYYAKRFKIETSTEGSEFSFIKDGAGNEVIWASSKPVSLLSIGCGKKKSELDYYELNLDEEIPISNYKTVGTKLSFSEVKEVTEITEENDQEVEQKSLF